MTTLCPASRWSGLCSYPRRGERESSGTPSCLIVALELASHSELLRLDFSDDTAGRPTLRLFWGRVLSLFTDPPFHPAKLDSRILHPRRLFQLSPGNQGGGRAGVPSLALVVTLYDITAQDGLDRPVALSIHQSLPPASAMPFHNGRYQGSGRGGLSEW